MTTEPPPAQQGSSSSRPRHEQQPNPDQGTHHAAAADILDDPPSIPPWETAQAGHLPQTHAASTTCPSHTNPGGSIFTAKELANQREWYEDQQGTYDGNIPPEIPWEGNQEQQQPQTVSAGEAIPLPQDPSATVQDGADGGTTLPSAPQQQQRTPPWETPGWGGIPSHSRHTHSATRLGGQTSTQQTATAGHGSQRVANKRGKYEYKQLRKMGRQVPRPRPQPQHGPGWGYQFQAERNDQGRKGGADDAPTTSSETSYTSDSSDGDHGWYDNHAPHFQSHTSTDPHISNTGDKASNKAKDDWKTLLNKHLLPRNHPATDAPVQPDQSAAEQTGNADPGPTDAPDSVPTVTEAQRPDTEAEGDTQPEEHPVEEQDDFTWPPDIPTTADSTYSIYRLNNDCWEIAIEFRPDFVPDFGGTHADGQTNYELHVIIAGDRGPLDRAPKFGAGTRLRLCP